MKQQDIVACERFGITPYKSLFRAYKRSLFCKTAFMEGEIVAIWGIMGTYLGNVGYPWSHLLPKTEKFPFKLIFRYRKELNEMLKLFPILRDAVDIHHKQTLRTLKIMGFEFSDPMPFGKNGDLHIIAEKRL